MKKIVVHRPGGRDRLELESHPSPPLGAGEVRIGVRAVGVNFADVFVRMGLYASAKQYVGWPITPGFEIAGEVTEVASDVDDFAEGDEVFAVTRFGGYATEIVVPQSQVFPRLQGFTIEQCAAFPTVFLSAYHALFNLAAVSPDSDVLIHSAAGGVGSALLQLACIAGCRTVGVVGGSHKVEPAERFGANVVIDRSRCELWSGARAASPEGYDAVFDGNGPATLAASYAHLRPLGRLVTYGFHSILGRRTGVWRRLQMGLNYLRIPRFHPMTLLDDNRSVMAFNLSFLFHRTELLERAMKDLTTWANEGKILPPEVTTFAFDDVAEAHAALESGMTTGKLVLI